MYLALCTPPISLSQKAQILCGSYPDFEHLDHMKHLGIPQVQLETKFGVKDCQFCRIFFSIIGQSDCACGENARDDHIPKSGGCRCKEAMCWFRSNGQLDGVTMLWTCGYYATYELGLPAGIKAVWSLYDLSNESFLTCPLAREAGIFPYIAPCMGDLYHNPVSDGSLALMKGWD